MNGNVFDVLYPPVQAPEDISYPDGVGPDAPNRNPVYADMEQVRDPQDVDKWTREYLSKHRITLPEQGFIPVRILPSDEWNPQNMSLPDAGSYPLAGKDPNRISVTIYNGSSNTVYLTKRQQAEGGMPLVAGASLTITTQDDVYVYCPSATGATPALLGWFTETVDRM